jgi:hypothetical protein
MSPYIRIPALLLLGALVTGTTVSAKQDRVTAENAHSGVSVTIPDHAVQVSANVWSLGSSIDQERGDVVEGYMIVHPKVGNGKPSGKPGGGGTTGSTCYTFLSSGAKWKGMPEPWVVNPTNTYDIPPEAIHSILANGIYKWETAATWNILGDGVVTTETLFADETSMDGKNEVYFGPLDSGTIGVTIVWGIFGGPTRNRELREWDQVYNTHYVWSASETGEVGKMDFDNIATHELGHAVGLGDLYTSACTSETMYGYGTEGETSKRDLNTGDIVGINVLY